MAVLVATVCYIGYFPFAPGTVGSALGLLVAYLTAGIPRLQFSIFIVLTVIGLWVIGRAETYFHKKDDRRIILDELVGMLVALFFLPYRWEVVVAAFLLFRIFDIVKPFPSNRVQSLAGGWGVMLDDVIAGIYTGVVLRLLLRIVPRLFS